MPEKKRSRWTSFRVQDQRPSTAPETRAEKDRPRSQSADGMDAIPAENASKLEPIPYSTLRQIREFLASFALAARVLGSIILFFSLIVIWNEANRYRVSIEGILFFSYLSPRLLDGIHRGYISFSTVIADYPVLGGLSALYGSLLLVVSFWFTIPFRDKNPYFVKVSLVGFAWSYIITLFIYGELALDYRLIPGMLRILWICLLFLVAERAKRTYPAAWKGEEHFRGLVDGLFALGATLIIQHGLDKQYDRALSGPIFLIVFFIFMSFFSHGVMRNYLFRVLIKVGPSDSRGRHYPRGLKSVPIIYRWIQRLRDLPYKDMLQEYKNVMGEANAARIGIFEAVLNPPLRLSHATYLRTALLFIFLLISGVAQLAAIWFSSNAWLYVMGVGR
ncbi:MAG: hypothetical protein KGM47_04935 [Acidobacteriota bacterium]|nr:hypothetical protein [Acidobacteriota bacterium]